MSVNWKGIWSSTTAYVVQDVVTYNNNMFQCIQANTGQTPVFGTDTAYWVNINPNSVFPNNLDSFIQYQNIQASDIPDIQQYQSLITTQNLTPDQQNTLNILQQKLRNKMFLPTDVNSITQAIQNLEAFFLNNVQGYINQQTSNFNTTLNQFSYKGIWSSTTQYQMWNIVTYNSNVYFAKQANLNNPPTTGDNSDVYWCLLSKQGAQGVPGLGNCTYLGVYSSSSSYSVGNVVLFNSSLYYCVTATTPGIDPSNGTYWHLFLSPASSTIISNTPPSNPVTNQTLWIDVTV